MSILGLVHLTGISSEDASRLLAVSNVLTGSASKHIRVQVKPLVQVGTAVPLFGLTKWGKELLIEKAKSSSTSADQHHAVYVLLEHKQPRLPV